MIKTYSVDEDFATDLIKSEAHTHLAAFAVFVPGNEYFRRAIDYIKYAGSALTTYLHVKVINLSSVSTNFREWRRSVMAKFWRLDNLKKYVKDVYKAYDECKRNTRGADYIKSIKAVRDIGVRIHDEAFEFAAKMLTNLDDYHGIIQCHMIELMRAAYQDM